MDVSINHLELMDVEQWQLKIPLVWISERVLINRSRNLFHPESQSAEHWLGQRLVTNPSCWTLWQC
jgi:hypothetical protein